MTIAQVISKYRLFNKQGVHEIIRRVAAVVEFLGLLVVATQQVSI